MLTLSPHFDPQLVSSPLVLGVPSQSTRERWADWNAYLNQNSAAFNKNLHMISSRESQIFPEMTVRLRSQILLKTYKNDYHTDAFEFERLQNRISMGRERVFFWGSEIQVSKLRGLIAARILPSAEELNKFELGTASLLDETDYYGTGYWELGRTGSITREIKATCPNLVELQTALYGDRALRKCHTIVCMPRNRESTDVIRGGSAIHRMQTQVIRSWFWGFAPWYVMQGGWIECLDYRELYLDPVECAANILNSAPLEFASTQEALFAQALLEHNLPYLANRKKVLTPPGSSSGKDDPSWHISLCQDKHLVKFNPCLVRHDSEKRGESLRSILSETSSIAPAGTIVFLPITKQMFFYQTLLSEYGFRLMAIIPPKKSLQKWVGQWWKPNSNIPIAWPYYRSLVSTNSAENVILDYLRQISGDTRGQIVVTHQENI